MKSERSTLNKLSVVIPTYNGAAWLPKSIPVLEEAIKRSGFDEAEILVVDDGSTDDTVKVIKTIKTIYPLRVITQENSGRFLARKLGAEKAKFSNILFIDTRIYIEPDALKFVLEEMEIHPDRKVWTSHVYLEKGNIYARFWDAIAYLAWYKYFSNPRDCSYGLKDFDKFPKGTTCFFVPKDVIMEANDWFLGQTKDLKTSNDDTLLIRRIAEHYSINISPEYACLYHARTSFRQYLRHVNHRGKVFVDGFFRRDGNKYVWAILAFLILSVAIPMAILLHHALVVPLLATGLVVWLLVLISSLLLGMPSINAFSLFILIPPFFMYYGAGIWVAVVNIYLWPKRLDNRAG